MIEVCPHLSFHIRAFSEYDALIVSRKILETHLNYKRTTGLIYYGL
jgi:hypothetical protein